MVHLKNTSIFNNCCNVAVGVSLLPITFHANEGTHIRVRPFECRPRYQPLKKCNKTSLFKNQSATRSLFCWKTTSEITKILKNPTNPKMPQTPHGNYKNPDRPGWLKNPHQGFAATSVPWRLSFFHAAMISKWSISGCSKKNRKLHRNQERVKTNHDVFVAQPQGLFFLESQRRKVLKKEINEFPNHQKKSWLGNCFFFLFWSFNGFQPQHLNTSNIDSGKKPRTKIHGTRVFSYFSPSKSHAFMYQVIQSNLLIPLDHPKNVPKNCQVFVVPWILWVF